MQHFIGYPTNSSFLCGEYAVGCRNTRNDTNPDVTTCKECKAHPYYKEVKAAADAKDAAEAL